MIEQETKNIPWPRFQRTHSNADIGSRDELRLLMTLERIKRSKRDKKIQLGAHILKQVSGHDNVFTILQQPPQSPDLNPTGQL